MSKNKKKSSKNTSNYTQSIFSALIKALLVVGIFGFIPGAWMIEIPLILGYGAIKAYVHRESIKRYIRRNFQRTVRTVFPRRNEEEDEPTWREWVGIALGNIVKKTWFKIAKGLIAFILLFTLPIPWSIFALYGLYRHSDRHLKRLLMQNLSGFYDFTVGLFKGTTRKLSFNQTLRNVIICSLLLAGGIYYSGNLFVVDLALTIMQSMIVWIGLNTALRDFGRAFKRPINMLCNNIGKILGGYFGRYFAYSFMTGKVTGSLGPAVGQVQSTGFFSELLTPLFSPAGLRFSNMSLFGRLLSSDFAHFVNGIFTSAFFTHSMQLTGDFYGVIGPTHFQIFLLMGIGCLMGYGIEKTINAFFSGVLKDCKNAKQASQPLTHKILNITYQARWHIGFITAATPFALMTTSAAPIVAFAGGSLIAATLGCLVTVFATLSLLYLVGHVVHQLYQARRATITSSHARRRKPIKQVKPVIAPKAPITPLYDRNQKRRAHSETANPKTKAKSRQAKRVRLAS